MEMEIKSKLQALANPQKAETYRRFFKTGKGQYSEGDIFIGVTVPDQRKVAKEFWNKISLEQLEILLQDLIHEYRLTALFILRHKFESEKDPILQKKWVNLYLRNIHYVNNWDLVDSSSYKILGKYCYEQSEDEILLTLIQEENLWIKRIAVVSTMYYVKKKSFELLKTLVLETLDHPHDLMHKANGWLLREMGKQSIRELTSFLCAHYENLPRTTLRYAIEKYPPEIRMQILQGKF